MQIVLFLILGIGIGVLVGWLWARSRETGILHQLLRTEGQQKAAAQAELRQTRTSLEELSSVRSQLSNESQRRVAAETKLQEAEANLEQQRKLLEEATAKLTDTFGALPQRRSEATTKPSWRSRRALSRRFTRKRRETWRRSSRELTAC